MKNKQHIYFDDTTPLHGYVAYPNTPDAHTPLVLIVHDWSGQNAFIRQKAEQIAALGYIGFAVDMYGEGKTGETTEEKQALMSPLVSDRQKLLKRILAALTFASTLPFVDPHRIAIMGFCFGGLCALDLARSGAAISGAISFHGLLNAPPFKTNSPIQANILVLHGYDDPMVRPQDVDLFCQEMTQAHANWQLHVYSQTQHAFMVPEANNPTLGTRYQPETEKRAWQVCLNFLMEQFNPS